MMKKMIMVSLMLILLAQAAAALQITVNDYDPKPAEAGKYVTVWIKLFNPSLDTLGEVSVRILPKDGFELAEGETPKKYVGSINAGAYSIVKYRLRVLDDAIEGINLFTLDVAEGTSTYQKDLELVVEDKDLKEVRLEVGDVDSDPRRMKPGDEFIELDIIIQNLGDAVAKGAKAELMDLPDGISFSESYSNIDLLGSIDEDSQVTAKFYIDINESVEPGEYDADLEVSYKYKPYEDEDAYMLSSEKLPVTLSVKATPLYEITSAELEPEELTAGDQGVKLRLTIKNIGEEEGDSVRVKIYPKTEHPFDFEVNNNIVAPTLMPGETGQATLEFDVEEDAAVQKYILDVEIKNLVGEDIVLHKKTVSIDVANALVRNPLNVMLIAVVAAAVIVVVVVVYSLGQKKKRKGSRKIKPKFEKSE